MTHQGQDRPKRPFARRPGGLAGIKPTSATVFAHIAFFTCLCLQRFGVPLGGNASLSISLPVFWGLIGWTLLTKRARIAESTAALFLLFAAWALLSAIGAVLAPDPRAGFSLLSLLNVLTLYAMLMVRPAAEFDGRKVLIVFLFYARLCAACGILQFMLQFVHVRLFSFGQMFPPLGPILLEKDFAWNPLLSYGSTTLRSNGFFLLEPSIFSQVLVVAVMLDVFINGRWRYLPLYTTAYMASFSGTGLASLAITLVLIGFTSSRNASRVVVLGLAAALTASVFAVLAPAQFAVFAGRFAGFGTGDASGHARYIGQIEEVRTYLRETRSFLGYGSGATVRSIFYVRGSGNAALQLFVDYGIVGLVLFGIFLVQATWRRSYAALSLLLIVNFEVGGGYLLFPPYILLVTALTVWGAGAQIVMRRMDQATKRASTFGLHVAELGARG